MQNAKTLDPVMLGRPVQAFDQLAALLARQDEGIARLWEVMGS